MAYAANDDYSNSSPGQNLFKEYYRRHPEAGKETKHGPTLLWRAKENARVATLLATARQRAALPVIAKAFGGARANLSKSAERSKRLLSKRPQGPMDALGNGTSSLTPLINRGIAAENARAYQEIDSRLADVLGPLGAQEAGLTAGVLGGEAGLLMSGAAMENNAAFQMAQLYAQKKKRKKGVGDLIGAAAPIVGGLLGGPAGFAAGAAFTTGAQGQLGGPGDDFDPYAGNW